MLNWVDLELLAFIERYSMGRVQWILTAYFGDHPHSEVTARMLAERTGISELDLHQPLQTLVNQGLVEVADTDGEPLYRLVSNERLRALARRFARQNANINHSSINTLITTQPV